MSNVFSVLLLLLYSGVRKSQELLVLVLLNFQEMFLNSYFLRMYCISKKKINKCTLLTL